MNELEIAIRIAAAGLAGLAVGVEREWSGHATGPDARFAGVRTFMLLGVIGGVAGWLSDSGGMSLGVALVAISGLMVVAAYVAATRRNADQIDGTTEVAAIAVLAIGALAGRGYLAISGGAAATILLFLSEKAAIRKFIQIIEDHEIRAAFQFAVLSLVVLPVLPTGPYGPFDAIRPRMVWTVVLIFSAINFAGYVARRVFGESKGFLITGALGGLISSTAVTLAYARRSRLEPQHATALAAGTVAASTVLIPRILAVTLALNPAFTPRAAVWLAGMLLAAVAMTIFAATRPQASSHDHPVESANPLQLGTAVKMALGFQLVLVALEYLRSWFGEVGVFAGAGLAGLTDMDALTMSMSRLAREPALTETAAAALVIGVLANTAVKAAAAVVLGESSYRRKVVPAFGMIAAAAGLTWWWLRSLQPPI